jgi:4-phospho-D-threonate 3-dehydrogenase / 4-phospho-D-erythronate 3-dehydrogenase
MRISHSDKKPLIITGGDPSGIGPETILKALKKIKLHASISPIIIGDYGVFQKTAKIIKANIPQGISFIDLRNISITKFQFGSINKIYGKAAIRYLALGSAMAMDMKNAALVTAPINKEAIKKAGFSFPGHTEFLACFTKSKNVTMMLVGENIRVGLVTRHIPIKDVAENISKEKIIKTTLNINAALKNIFDIKNPKIGIASLNPHAGDGGVIGNEDKSIIIPAVKMLQRKINNVFGPYPADIVFHKAYNKKLDAVIAMYHDQGLIPLKMVAFDKGVNITLGLPFMRTSPDHGTGFDIAGSGKADPTSMIEAIKLAEKHLINKC